MKLSDIPLILIDAPDDPHRLNIEPGELDELAASIKANGLQQPIKVRPIGDRFRIVYGHRRFLAHYKNRAPTIRAYVDDTLTDETEENARFAENLDRQDLTPMEEAVAIARELARPGASAEGLAARLHRSVPWIKHRAQLLALPDELKALVHQGALPIGCALALLRVTEPEHQRYLARFAVDSGANIRVIEQWISNWELERAQNPDAAPTLPTYDASAPTITVTVPCFVCRDPYDYTRTIITRVCPRCHHAVTLGGTDLCQQPSTKDASASPTLATNRTPLNTPPS